MGDLNNCSLLFRKQCVKTVFRVFLISRNRTTWQAVSFVASEWLYQWDTTENAGITESSDSLCEMRKCFVANVILLVSWSFFTGITLE